jgi:hypothetical protein
MAVSASSGTKKVYEDKADGFLKTIVAWLKQNMLTSFEVVHQGVPRKMVEWLKGHRTGNATVKELLELTGSTCLASCFEDRYPKYPKFTSKLTVSNLKQPTEDVIRWLAGGVKNQLATAVLDGLELLDGDKLKPHNSRYAKADILISRSTLCGWLEQCAQLFKPLVELMHKEVLKSEAIQGDETPVPVLDRSRDSTRQGYIWTTIGDRAHPYTTFHYTDSRSRDGPAEFLKGYTGYLQTDAYASYESVVNKSAGKIIAVGCWAHVRREFFDARHNQPREVHYVLGLISQLYDVEDDVRGRSGEERLAARQERSLPVLKRLEEYLREQQGLALPKSQFGKAINYALNHWEALLRYASDGRLEIDNNSSERTLRPCAIGRKNWMFFGSDRGGETAAILMSILASAKRHGIEPFEYEL